MKKKNKNKGVVFWITGLPGSGKTTMIDIKTRSNGGSNSSTKRSKLQKEMNVQILLYLSDTRELRFVDHKE